MARFNFAKAISRKLHGEVGAGRGGKAVIPLQLRVSTLPNMSGAWEDNLDWGGGGGD